MNRPLPPDRLDLHIGELVLEGFAPGDRHRIGDVVQSELSRLFAEQGVPESLSSEVAIERVDGGAFNMSSATNAHSIGAQVAQTIYRGLSQ